MTILHISKFLGIFVTIRFYDYNIEFAHGLIDSKNQFTARKIDRSDTNNFCGTTFFSLNDLTEFRKRKFRSLEYLEKQLHHITS